MRRTAVAEALAVFLLTVAVVGAIRLAGPPIYDGDGWYHVKYAEILRHDGISRSFPWFQESFLRDRFTDFNLFYHLLLIPFTLGDPLAGARAASILLAGVAMALWVATARSLGAPRPWLWGAALLALAPDFTYRLAYTRPLVLAIGLSVAGAGAVLTRRHRLAFAIAWLFAYVHCSLHFLPCFALLHDGVREGAEDEPWRERFRATFWTLGGVAAGLVVNPYFPNAFRMWWVTNVDVLRASWAMGDALRVGTEMLPVSTGELFAANAGVFVAFFAALWLLATRGRGSTEARALFPVALGFLALAFLSRRFVELWAPFTFLLAAVAARDALSDPGTRARLSRLGLDGQRASRVTAAVAAALVAVALVRTVAENRAAARAEDPPSYLEAGAWMRDRVPPGETIFNPGWDEFPELFYADSTHRYLIGQDATFMWATDPARTRLWTEVARGRIADPHAAIRGTFGCRFLFLPGRYETLARLVRRDPRFHEVWTDGATSVFRLDDDGSTIGGFAGRGWQPDPARRGFEISLDAEPGAASGPAVVRAEPVTSGPGGFVNLGRLLDVPPSVPGACAVVTASIDAPVAGPATLGLTTDDEVKLWIDGKLLLARSPYREPPPGAPGGPPVALDAALAPGARSVPERAVEAPLRAGANEVVVKACRVGEDFGFVLRRLPAGVTP